MTTQHDKAHVFHGLHHAQETLILLNAWDAASARIFEVAGAKAIATTSAGVANALGFPDGEHVGRALMLEAVGRIVNAVDIPVSVDLEMGYGSTVDEVCRSVEAVIDLGGVGINIEDGLRDPVLLVDRITAIRERAASRGVTVFVNARTDVYLRGTGEPAAKFADAVHRLRLYAEAGADGVFAPGLADPDTIHRLVREVDRPLNILGGAGVPPLKELERLGVARLSVGSGPMRATMALTRTIAEQLLHSGIDSLMVQDALSPAEANGMFRRTPAAP